MLNAILSSAKSPCFFKKEENNQIKRDKDDIHMQQYEKEIKEEKNLLHYHPFITNEEYKLNYAIGDIPVKYWDKVSKNVDDLNGKWQVIINRSDSVDGIMKALGYNAFKRQVMSIYPSIAEFSVCRNNNNNTNARDTHDYPIISITTHLPLNFVKKGTVEYNASVNTFHDSELGAWHTSGIYIDGRAIQRREGKKGLMFDTRVIFNQKDFGDVNDQKVCDDDMPVQLFRWTYIPHDTGIPLVSNRWFKKIE